MTDRIWQVFRECKKVSTDTRALKGGEIYFALKGGQFNGNLFARNALEAGALLAVVDEDPGFEDERLVRVPDCLFSLQQLALTYRRTFSIPFLAITGSNGKTTTKELVRDVLARKFAVHATTGNLNNHIGVPLTILSMPAETTFAIIEMGANHQQEIAGYCAYTEPTHGLITNIGKAHLEGFGGVEGVKRGKKELYDYVASHRGKVFVNTELPALDEISRGMDRIPYGFHSGPFQLEALEGRPTLVFRARIDGADFGREIVTRLAGNFNLYNVASAMAVGHFFGVPAADMVAAIEAYDPDNNRSQLVMTARNRVIMDAYNANPSSMLFALKNLRDQNAPRSFFIIGDMLELGEEGPAEHRDILRYAKELGLEGITIGPLFAQVAGECGFRSFDTAASARAWIGEHPVKDALILVKGSRGIRLEQLADVL